MFDARLTVNGLLSQPQTVCHQEHNLRMDASQYTPPRVLALNVKALLDSGIGPTTQNDLALKAGVAQATIGRVLEGETAAKIDTVDGIARAYGLEGWQLLVAGMDPKNPPVLQPVSPQERALWASLKQNMAQLAQMEAAKYSSKP